MTSFIKDPDLIEKEKPSNDLENSINDKGGRHCFKCDLKVEYDAESCLSCQEPLFTAKRPLWQVRIISFLCGVLIAGIILVIMEIVLRINNQKINMAVFAISLWSAYSAIKSKLTTRKDLAIWKDKSGIQSNVT